MVVAPYDTELIGHWWSEGPEWLYQVLKRLHDHTQVSLSPGVKSWRPWPLGRSSPCRRAPGAKGAITGSGSMR